MRCPVLCFGCQRSAVIRVIGSDIYADYLHNVSSRIVRYGPDGALRGEIPIPEHHVASLRSHGEGSALLSLTSLLTPQTVLELDIETTRAPVTRADVRSAATRATRRWNWRFCCSSWGREGEGRRRPG